MSNSILSVSSLLRLFLLLLLRLLVLLIGPTVTLDRVLSSDWRGLQSPLSSVRPLSSDDIDHLDCSFNGESRTGVLIAMPLRLRRTLSSALSTPLSAPPDLYTRGEADMGVLCMIEDRWRLAGLFVGDGEGMERCLCGDG